MSTPSLADKRISIIGAGPGGLTCARILQRHGIPVNVYDGDSDAHPRNQGGSLDLHEDDGQLALRTAGLLDEFYSLARFHGQEMRVLGTDAKTLIHQVPEADSKSAPEVDRGELRDMLVRAVSPGTVKWGHTLQSISGPDQGPRTLIFTNGTTIETDLVIGADGAFSCVRGTVSSAMPQYSGVPFLEAWFDNMPTAHPELSELVGPGSAMASDGERALFAQRNSGDHMRVYIVRRAPVDWIGQAGLQPDDTDGIRDLLLDEFEGWSPDLLRMITDNDGRYVDRPLWVLPAPHTWEPSSTVTLLGDAAHLMPPAGVGVNLAMLDASELALSLAGADTVDKALRAYESTMFPRTTEIAVSLDGHADFLLDMDPDSMFGDDGPRFEGDGPPFKE